MLLSVIIVHYRVPLYLEQCVCSLEEALAGMEAEIIVVNNHSNSLQSSSPISREGAEVRWIDSGGNIGFAAACNLGWKQAYGKYILLNFLILILII
jgi:GT2 family glycosyltransferase